MLIALFYTKAYISSRTRMLLYSAERVLSCIMRRLPPYLFIYIRQNDYADSPPIRPHCRFTRPARHSLVCVELYSGFFLIYRAWTLPHQSRRHPVHQRNAGRFADLGHPRCDPWWANWLRAVLSIGCLYGQPTEYLKSMGRRHVVPRRISRRIGRDVAVCQTSRIGFLAGNGFCRTAGAAGFGFRPYR